MVHGLKLSKDDAKQKHISQSIVGCNTDSARQ